MEHWTYWLRAEVLEFDAQGLNSDSSIYQLLDFSFLGHLLGSVSLAIKWIIIEPTHKAMVRIKEIDTNEIHRICPAHNVWH